MAEAEKKGLKVAVYRFDPNEPIELRCYFDPPPWFWERGMQGLEFWQETKDERKKP